MVPGAAGTGRRAWAPVADCVVGLQFPLGLMKSSEIIVNALNAMELYTLTWLQWWMLRYVDFITI